MSRSCVRDCVRTEPGRQCSPSRDDSALSPHLIGEIPAGRRIPGSAGGRRSHDRAKRQLETGPAPSIELLDTTRCLPRFTRCPLMARLSASTVRQPMRRRRNTRSCSTASSTRRRRVDGTRPPFCRSGKRLAGRERALCFLSPVGRVTASSPFRSRAPSVPSAEVPRRRPPTVRLVVALLSGPQSDATS